MLPRPTTSLLPRSCRPLLAVRQHVARRTFIGGRQRTQTGRVTETLNVEELARRRTTYDRNRIVFLGAGAVAGVIAFVYTAWQLKEAIQNPKRLDSALPPSDPLVAGDDVARKVVVHDSQGREVVPTGNSVVPNFPRTIDLPTASGSALVQLDEEKSRIATGEDSLAQQGRLNPVDDTKLTEYTLVGLGLRTVSFLGIGVYVVGYYVATADVAALQARLVKKVNPLATTLIPGEKDQLRSALLDPVQGEQMWKELLEEGIPARSAFRIVPVRDTDFHHLRDGFVRAIQARSADVGADKVSEAQPGAPDFGKAIQDFRQAFNRGKVPKRRELILARGEKGDLSLWIDDGRRQLFGHIADERLSRALWLNYLAGKAVASEPARKNIVEGVIEFVERPVGTVAAQVV